MFSQKWKVIKEMIWFYIFVGSARGLGSSCIFLPRTKQGFQASYTKPKSSNVSFSLEVNHIEFKVFIFVVLKNKM